VNVGPVVVRHAAAHLVVRSRSNQNENSLTLQSVKFEAQFFAIQSDQFRLSKFLRTWLCTGRKCLPLTGLGWRKFSLILLSYTAMN